MTGIDTIAETDMPARQTVVSLTFDDGHDDQLEASRIMDRLGLKGTFYISSGLIAEEDAPGDPGTKKMTLADVRALQAGGHEIGGHTVSHADLAALSPEEVQRQVCKDRTNLMDLGLRITSFAYPFGAATHETERITAGCGYNSARGLGDLLSPDVLGVANTCDNCPVAETMPPANAFRTRAPNQQENTWTLADLQGTVTNAETTGGWLQLTFHHVDDTGGVLSVPPSVFDAFSVWLAARAEHGTVVKTVDEVIGGSEQVAADPPARATSGNLVRNPGYETRAPDGETPECWQRAGWGENRRSFTLQGDAHTGDTSHRLHISKHVDGDAKLLPTMDLGTCSPPVESTKAYDLGAWYKSSVETQFEIYIRHSDGSWTYWTSSPLFPPTDEWTHATFTTPPVPDGVDGLSFGLNLMRAGTLITDDYSQTVDIDWRDFASSAMKASWALLWRSIAVSWKELTSWW
ncbi:polysaccharide deacetylase family protein [Arthrobacter sp. NPDC092385]|uniref:polysaccharide deacetylase family protein n=1 Tax=Arthrobacter sp. NPDC092385 TaxID=3363943 RepID=UPI0038105FFD